MKIFKFGGASVKDADAVRNVANILNLYQNQKLVIVISAMGKSTNALEAIMNSFWKVDGETNKLIDDLNNFHQKIIVDLFADDRGQIEAEVTAIFNALKVRCNSHKSDNYNFEYDQIISLGEVISTKIVSSYLHYKGWSAVWLDARELIRTN